MINPILSMEYQGAMLGVPGRFSARTVGGANYKAGTFTHQRFISQQRAIRGYGKGAMLQVFVRFDDDCRNGYNSFAITAEVRVPGRREVEACGCLHADIERVFPEFAPLIKWHLTGADGPMHYIANTLYHAGNRDHRGLRAGEKRPLINGRTKKPVWELVAVMSPGVAISTTPTGLEYQGAESVPLFILEKSWDGESPPATPRLEWRRKMVVGEGKERDFAAARACAVWPEATDEQLSLEPAELKALLIERAGNLQADFRAVIEACGLVWAP